MRVSKGLSLREAGVQIALDQTILRKIKRGDGMPTRGRVITLSEIYEEQKNDMIIARLNGSVARDKRYGIRQNFLIRKHLS